MNWEPARLDDILTERKGRIKHTDANQLDLQRIKKIDFSGNIHLDTRTDTRTDMIRVKTGDLVISGINAAKGAIAVYQGEQDALATIHYSAYQFNPERISVDFLKWFFKSPEFATLLKEQVSGGIKTEIKPKHILPLKVKLPRFPEQLRIANRPDRFYSEHMKLIYEIIHQESLLSKLKQAILQEAIQGKLTIDWRKENPEVEPASQLLERIRKEKQRLIAEKKLRKEKPLSEIVQDEIPFEIPKGWIWCRMGILIKEKPRNGISLKPVGYQTGTKILKLSATSSGNFDGSQCKYLDCSIEPDSHLWLRDGDILIQRANSLELVGTAAIYRGRDFEFVYPDLMMKRRTMFPESTNYLLCVLSSRFARDYFKNKASGSAGNFPKISQHTLMSVLVPFPSLAEQVAIVERVDAMMTTCNALKAEIKHSYSHTENTLQAVLKEVFTPA